MILYVTIVRLILVSWGFCAIFHVSDFRFHFWYSLVSICQDDIKNRSFWCWGDSVCKKNVSIAEMHSLTAYNVHCIATRDRWCANCIQSLENEADKNLSANYWIETTESHKIFYSSCTTRSACCVSSGSDTCCVCGPCSWSVCGLVSDSSCGLMLGWSVCCWSCCVCPVGRGPDRGLCPCPCPSLARGLSPFHAPALSHAPVPFLSPSPVPSPFPPLPCVSSHAPLVPALCLHAPFWLCRPALGPRSAAAVSPVRGSREEAISTFQCA